MYISLCLVYTVLAEILTVTLIWRFGEHVKIAKLTYAIIDLFVLQAWVSLHTELKSANLKSCQQRFLSKPPNIMFVNISAYTVASYMYTY